VGVRVDWSVAVVLVLFGYAVAAGVLPAAAPGHSTAMYWLVGGASALVLLGYLLAHELGHAMVAQHFGVRISTVTLWMLGGITELEDDAPTPRAAALIAAAGPAVNVVGGVSALVAAHQLDEPLIHAALDWLGGCNLLLAGFNLIPGAPLDGGRLLRALVWWRTGDARRASLIGARVGRAAGLALLLLAAAELLAGDAFAIWPGLIAWYLIQAATRERDAALQSGYGDVTVGALMRPQPLVVPDWWTVRQVLGEVDARGQDQPAVPVTDPDGGCATRTTCTRTGPEAHRAGDVRPCPGPRPGTTLYPMSVLLAYTPTSEGWAALRAAIDEAHWRKVPLIVMNVAVHNECAEPTFADEKDLDAVEHRLIERGIDFEIVQTVDAESVSDAVLTLAAEREPELIVIGAHRRSPLGKAIAGSTTQHIVLSADCPVLVVRTDADAA